MRKPQAANFIDFWSFKEQPIQMFNKTAVNKKQAFIRTGLLKWRSTIHHFIMEECYLFSFYIFCKKTQLMLFFLFIKYIFFYIYFSAAEKRVFVLRSSFHEWK